MHVIFGYYTYLHRLSTNLRRLTTNLRRLTTNLRRFSISERLISGICLFDIFLIFW